MKTTILDMVKQTIDEVEKYVLIFKKYEYIWLDDKQEYVENVIRIGGDYFAVEDNDLFDNIQLQQFKDKSISLFNDQVNATLSVHTLYSFFLLLLILGKSYFFLLLPVIFVHFQYFNVYSQIQGYSQTLLNIDNSYVI